MQQEKQKIEDVLVTNGKYIGPTSGVSMLPMLKDRRDTIDVALYKRGDLYVLHRVLSVTPDGYIIRGDNCYTDENVPENAVIGVLSEFFRKDKHYYCTDEKYLKYVKKRLKTYKVRRFFVLLKAICKSAAKKILHAFGLKK